MTEVYRDLNILFYIVMGLAAIGAALAPLAIIWWFG